MKNFFNVDNPFMIFMSKLTDIVVLNLVCLLCSLPIFTMGASLTALHYVTLKMVKDEDGYVLKDFFRAFKENFKQSTIVWLIFIVISGIFFVDLKVLTSEALNFPKVLPVSLCVVYLFIIITMLYVFPLISRFRNTIKTTLKNAFLMSVIHIFKTFVMVICYLIPVILIPVNFNFIAVYLLLGLSAPAYINSYMLRAVFRKYEPEADQEEVY